MWDTEGLVQIQVRNIAAELARRTDPDHRIHIGAVDVNLPPVLMNQFAYFGYIVFKYTVGRRIGDHDRSQVIAVLLALGPEVIHIDIARFGSADHYHFHAGHLCRGRVGAMRRSRYDTNIAMSFIAALVV